MNSEGYYGLMYVTLSDVWLGYIIIILKTKHKYTKERWKGVYETYKENTEIRKTT